jgi:hypothetical protein
METSLTPLGTWLHFWASTIGAVGGMAGTIIAAMVSSQVRQVHGLVNSQYTALQGKLAAQSDLVLNQAGIISGLYADILDLKREVKVSESEGKH